jgi:hypothetical protein
MSISWIDEDGKTLERQSQTRGRDDYIGTIQGRRVYESSVSGSKKASDDSPVKPGMGQGII